MNSVIKGASYILAHTPDMVIHNGTTQTTERIVNPESEYLKKLPEHLCSFEDTVSYWPNQVYIGNETPVESMKDCSVVTATYELQDGMKGTIGIIGPKRMDYEMVVETLNNIRMRLDDLFSKN